MVLSFEGHWQTSAPNLLPALPTTWTELASPWPTSRTPKKTGHPKPFGMGGGTQEPPPCELLRIGPTRHADQTRHRHLWTNRLRHRSSGFCLVVQLSVQVLGWEAMGSKELDSDGFLGPLPFEESRYLWCDKEP